MSFATSGAMRSPPDSAAGCGETELDAPVHLVYRRVRREMTTLSASGSYRRLWAPLFDHTIVSEHRTRMDNSVLIAKNGWCGDRAHIVCIGR